jgi:hypothetical protein
MGPNGLQRVQDALCRVRVGVQGGRRPDGLEDLLEAFSGVVDQVCRLTRHTHAHTGHEVAEGATARLGGVANGVGHRVLVLSEAGLPRFALGRILERVLDLCGEFLRLREVVRLLPNISVDLSYAAVHLCGGVIVSRHGVIPLR